MLKKSTGQIPHGTNSSYTNHKCRCDRCSKAHATLVNEQRKVRYAQRLQAHGYLIHPNAKHGDYSGYVNYGCRCPECQGAMSAYQEVRKART